MQAAEDGGGITSLLSAATKTLEQLTSAGFSILRVCGDDGVNDPHCDPHDPL